MRAVTGQRRQTAVLRADLRGLAKLASALLLNAVACVLIACWVGGSAFLGEVPHHQPPFIEIDGERVIVAAWLYHFSFWHGLSVMFSVPCFFLLATWIGLGHAWAALSAQVSPSWRS